LSIPGRIKIKLVFGVRSHSKKRKEILTLYGARISSPLLIKRYLKSGKVRNDEKCYVPGSFILS
jgi:hypothetical protein